MKTLYSALRQQLNANALAISLKTAIILATTIVIFYQDLAIIANDALQSEFMSHILAIPFLFSYLIYRKRKMIRASIPFEPSPSHRKAFPYKEIVGTLLFLIAVLTYWYGSYTFTPLEYHMASLPIFVAGCTLLVFNTKTLKTMAFPIAFLFFLTPPPLQVVYQAGAALSTFSSQAAYNILKILGLPISLTTQYGIPVIILQKTGGQPLTFAIDIACSGLYSLMGFLIFTVFITYIARTSLWKRAAMFFIGFPLIYALNILRITIIVLIGNYAGMELAMQTFHVLGGWFLIFLGTLLLLIISEKLFKIKLFTKKPNTITCPKCSQSKEQKQNFCFACGKLLKNIDIKLRKFDFIKIAALLIAVIFLISIQAPIFALTEGPAEIIIQSPTGEQGNTEILPQMSAYTLKFIYRDKHFEQIAKQDASLTYAYFPATNESEEIIWVTVEIAKSKSCVHPWEVCLITYPQTHGEEVEVTQLDLRDVQLIENPPIIARYFAFQHKSTNVTEVVLYWYEYALFQTNSTSQHKYVKISLIAYADHPEDIPATEEKLLPFAEAIANYWQPIKTWSQIAITISQNGATLIAITTATLTTIVSAWIIKKQTQKKLNQKIYQKLSEKDRKILLAVHKAEQKHKATTNEIASAYTQLTGEHIELNTLLETLNNAKEISLLRQDITNKQDEPLLTWKAEISFP